MAKPKALLQVGGVHGMARSLQNLAREGMGDTELDNKMLSLIHI